MSKKAMMFLTACIVCVAAFFVSAKTTDALTLVLDPGHDNVHTGAQGNGLREEYLNLQIALACKNELETYQGVTVHMVRADEACPYGGASVGSSTACNGRRVDFAASVGANAYISLHNNSSTNTSARGASVYYPTENYDANCGRVGRGLALSILGNLKTTGLQDRGISTRLSGDNTRYPDGSLADYYGVIRRSKLAHIPAIIVEHAFISNPYDASEFLSSNGKLWNLGVLDARAIASYYMLQKKPTLDYTNASVSGKFQNNNQEYELEANGIHGADYVTFMVWSAQGGQDDICGYTCSTGTNGTWRAVVPIGYHKTEGTYYVDVYANDNVFVRRMEFEVRGPSLSRAEVLNMDGNNGTFDIRFTGVISGTDISAVSVQMWRHGDPGNAKWFQCSDMGSGVYQKALSIADFGDAYGTYELHTYILDKNNILKCVDKRSIDIQKPEVRFDVKGHDNDTTLALRIGNLPYDEKVSQVYVDVSRAGSEDIVRYQLNKDILEEWGTYLYTARLGAAGTYTLRAYEKLTSGTEILIGEQTYEVPELAENLEGVQTGQGGLLFNGNRLTVCTSADSYVKKVNINPWCDYGRLDEIVGADREFVAYEVTTVTGGGVTASGDAVTGDSVTASGDAVTGDGVTASGSAVTGDAVSVSGDAAAVTNDAISASGDAATATTNTVIIRIPRTLVGREPEVYRLSDDGTSLLNMHAQISEDETEITVSDTLDGTYVLSAKKERIFGDVDGSGTVDLQDVSKALRLALRIDIGAVKEVILADVDCDAQVTMRDAYAILRMALLKK